MIGSSGPGSSGGSGGSGVRVAIVDDERMVLEGLHAWIDGRSSELAVVAAVTSWSRLLVHPEYPVDVVLLDLNLKDGVPVEVKLATLRAAGVAAVTSWSRLLVHPEYPVDVVLLDLNLKDGVPVEVKLATLRAAGVAAVMISTFADPGQIRACIAAGARAYLPKTESAEEIMRAVLAAAAGRDYITSTVAALLIADRQVAGDRSDVVPHLSPQETRALTLYASGLPMKAVARRLQVSYDTAKDYVDRVRQKYEEVGRSARTKVELYQRALEDGFIAGQPRHGGDAGGEVRALPR